MNATDISFPGLGIYLKDVPKTFHIGNFSIAMYGIIIAIAVLAGLYIATYIAKKTGQNDDLYWGFAIFEIIFGFAGARIYFVICSWDYYKDNFWSVFNLRQGGIAIYGGVIAAFITLFIYCKVKKLNPFVLGDTAIPALILGQAIGRWGNFFNREVFGQFSDNFLAMRLPVAAVRRVDISADLAAHMAELGVSDYIQVHPTFLYESVWNLLVFALLMFMIKRKAFHGELCLIYFAGYGVGRFWIEGIRTDQLKIPHTTIPISQVVAIVLIVVAIVGEIGCRVMIKKNTLPKCFRHKKDEAWTDDGKAYVAPAKKE